MLALGVETSCDETAIAVVENGKRILSNVVSSSLHLHKRYGGVIPEIATRYHVELITFVLARALNKARIKLEDLDLICPVYGPGLIGALLVGISLAKTLSLSLDIPLVGVNHLQAHIYAALMRQDKMLFPFVGLVISGGHTTFFYVKDFARWEMLGTTLDDATGEAFDKVAKILKLGYPGGPVIERLAKRRKRKNIRFPRSYLRGDSLDFSFSGLKTAVLYYVQDKEKSVISKQKSDIAAGFQEAVVDVLVDKAIKACLFKRVREMAVGGGVVRNLRIREALGRSLKKQGVKVYFPQSALCQDNAAMVAGLGYHLYRKGLVANLNLEAQPNLI